MTPVDRRGMWVAVGAYVLWGVMPLYWHLLKTVPSVRGARAARLNVIEGQPPILTEPPAACTFRRRCAHAFDRCARENPLRRPVGPSHDVACFWDYDKGGPADA